MLRLRVERLRRGWSQTHVTVLTGISGPAVSALELGRVHPHPGWRRRLAEAFGMDEATLFEEVSDQEPAAR
jgi:putative transcriptional regulator